MFSCQLTRWELKLTYDSMISTSRWLSPQRRCSPLTRGVAQQLGPFVSTMDGLRRIIGLFFSLINVIVNVSFTAAFPPMSPMYPGGIPSM